MALKERGESFQQPKAWNYEQFKAYLLLFSHNKNAILTYSEYPKTIQLNTALHEYLNEIRSKTKDGFERCIFICTNPDSNSLFVPKQIAKGDRHQVPGNIIDEEMKKASKNHLKAIIDTHSHPNKSWFSNQIFSTGDLYNIITPYQDREIMCLVEKNSNLLVFCSKETEMINYSKIFSQEQFIEYWDKHSSGPMDAAMKIAKRHKLVIYSGKSNKDLTRITT